MSKQVLCVFGTRPEAIKLAPVVQALIERGITPILCNSGQQRDLTRAALADFGLVPDLDLDLMRARQTPEAFVAVALPPLGRAIARVEPRMVIVQGDTATTLAGALAAAYARVPLGHVEAGLRSGASDPFPEDLHRRLVAQAATHHFAPTVGARGALIREGVDRMAISVTGNPVIDALRWAAARLDENPGLRARVEAELPPPGRPLVLVTAHRRENHPRMPAIAEAIAALAAAHAIDVVVPVHPNPATHLCTRLAGIGNVHLVPPLSYFAFVTLLRRARLVLTDSGGVQEEAPAFGCPVLILRDATERPEGIAAGAARLVGTDPAAIVAAAGVLLMDDDAHAAMAVATLPYGDGRAAERIARIVAGLIADPVEGVVAARYPIAA